MKYKILCILLILTYIFSGCINLTKSSKTNSNQDVSYLNEIEPIIKENCTTCHGGNQPAASIDLTTYESVRSESEKGDLLTRINSKINPMPQSGLMPYKLRKQIQLWAKAGYPKGVTRNDADSNSNANWKFIPPTINAINLNESSLKFFELMQGHWVGKINIMGQKMDWFAFDYRPISPSHIHGIFEGGTMGNLFTSFFITNYKGVQTIMARNGGLLNGIYRTSYFVLDKVELSENRNYFRLVDAYGGKQIMWMELEFHDDQLNFNSYTSRFGQYGKPKIHMKFKAKRMHEHLSKTRAKELNYPQNTIDKDFKAGLPTPKWDSKYDVITSATYIAEDSNLNLFELAKAAKDPYPINEIPFLSSLDVKFFHSEKSKNQKILLYLSEVPLTDPRGQLMMEYGYVKKEVFDRILSFPEIIPNQKSFMFYYLHPGKYYITAVADINNDGFASKGDVLSKSEMINIAPNSNTSFNIKNIIHQN